MKPEFIRQLMRICIVAAGAFLVPNMVSAQPFTTGMAAGQVLGQPDLTTVNPTPSQSIMRGPGCVAFSSTGKMAVAETSGSRVLIWNSIPTANGQPADVVIGQTNFAVTSSGTSATQLSTPGAVAFSPDGSKLLITDGLNNRVLIYNSIPTTNGAAADVVIGQTDFITGTSGTTAAKFFIPSGLLVTPDGKLLVSDQNNNRVLIFNSIPTTNGAAADVVIGQTDFTSGGGGVTSSRFSGPQGMALSSEGQLLVADFTNNRVLIFATVPTTNGAAAVNVIGQPSFATVAQPVTPAANNMDGPNGIAISSTGQLAISAFSDNRVLIFNTVPTTDGASADAVLGQPGTTSDGVYNPGGTPSATNMSVADVPAYSPDGRLWVPGRNMRRVMVFGTGDYVVTTTGNAIVVTDATGNSDTLTVSEPVAGSIKFAAAGRTFTVDGAPALLGDSGNLSLAGITSITINAAAGSDTINMSAFTGASFPSLTINGGKGDDLVNLNGSITFAADANLDLDLQNDNASPGTDGLEVGTNSVISTSGTGTIVAKVSRRVAMTTGAKFTTVNGGITLEGNLQAVPTTGVFSAIRIDGATIQSTGTGQIVLKGHGGEDSTTPNHRGIALINGSVVSTIGADITLEGRGGSSSNGGLGIGMQQNSDVVTVTGNIHLTGFAAPSTELTSRAYGIYFDSNATVTSTGTGPGVGSITLDGTGSTGQFFTHGVIMLTGEVRAVDADISVTGVAGNGTGSSNHGIGMRGGAKIRTTGTGTNAGNVTINGTGGLGNFGALGLEVMEPNTAVTTVDGTIDITGLGGGGTGPYNEGVGVFGGGFIGSTGTGPVIVRGTGNGAAGGTESNGVAVRDTDSSIGSAGGAISITGTAGTGANSSGIRIGYNAGVAGVVDSAGGPITFTADSIFFDTGASIVGGSGTVAIRQKTNGTQINLGAADSSGVLGLTDAELDHVTAGTLAIGDTNSGAITVSAIISPVSYKTLAFGKDTSFAVSGGFASDVSSPSDYEKMTVTGTVNITAGAAFSVASSGGYVWNGADSFAFLTNDSTDAIVGTFTGPTLTSFLGSALTATQTYTGFSGNDFVVGNPVAPTFANVAPPMGGLSGGNTVTITGSGFTGAIQVFFNGIPVTSFTVVNDTTIIAVVPSAAASGAVPVAVVAPGGTVSQGNAYAYVDYTVATTGNAIVVTDQSGNGETLTISQPSAGNIKFAAAGRTFSVDGGAPITGDSGNVPLAGTTSITVNAAGGDDTVIVSAFTSVLPSFTINGGVGDDAVNITGGFTLASNENLDLDLQNDGPAPSVDRVNVGVGVVINTSGTGSIVARASRHVAFNTGSSLTTVNGGITLEANQQAVPTAGVFAGVFGTGGSLISTGSGAINVAGRGGIDSATGFLGGVGLINNFQITTTTADITITGNGGAGLDNNWGVVLRTSADIATVSGNISITGVCGSATSVSGTTGSIGVYMDGSSTVTSTGTGPGVGGITINGTGSNGVNNNGGVWMAGAGTSVSSVDGDISITGTGVPTTGATNHGVRVYVGASVKTTGTGPNAGSITVNGTGGVGTFGSLGVEVISADSRISTVDGALNVTGLGGGGTGPYNEGVGVFGGGFIGSTGTGPGVGAVTIIGTGNGAAGGTESNGVAVRDTDSSIGSAGGSITITGTKGTGANSSGIRLGYNGVAPGVIDSAGGPITLIADSMFFDTTASIIGGSGTVTLRQQTNGTQIDLGAADSAGVLGLTDAELDHITADTVAIGDINSAGINFSAVISPTNYNTLALGKDTTFAATGGFAADVTSASLYEKMTVAGTVSINPSALFTATAVGGYVWNGTDNFVFLANDSTDAITGSFSGPALGSFLGSALTATETYVGLTGNDFVVGSVVVPTIAIVSPPVGGLVGGNTVTITGTGFTGATGVTFGGVPVTSFIVVNDTTITAVVPASVTAGPVTVAVIGGGGTASQTNGYTYIDYVVTTNATSITVTDIAGNGDALAITEPVAGSIKFAAAGRYFSVNSGAPISGDSGDLPLSGITSITVNNEAGADTISVSAFSGTSFPSLTINGGKGNDVVNLNGSITFAAGASLDLDLQNDDATPGTDTVNLGAGAVINTSGSGTITARTSSRIALFAGSKFTTVDGGITLEANQQGVPTTGNLTGVRLDAATVQSTGTGAIVFKGRGADDAATNSHVGIVLFNGSTVSTIGSDITFNGKGGVGTAFGAGIAIRTNCLVTSVTGHIDFTGVGAPATSVNSLAYGIYMDLGGKVTSTGTDPAVGGITMHGTGSTGLNFTAGVTMFHAGTEITAVDGDISITAIAGDATGTRAYGFNAQLESKIRSTGTGPNAGNVTINGTAGLGTFAGVGVQLDGPDVEVSVVDGDLNINGTGGGGTGQFNEGVGVFGGAVVRSTGAGPGAGAIAINGTGNGAAGGTESNGVSVRSDGVVSSVDGAVSITGTPGTGAGTFGIHLGYAAPFDGGVVQTTGAAASTLIADSMFFDTGATIDTGTAPLTLRQKTNGTQINLGGADAAGVLGLTNVELDKVAAGTLNIGDANSGMMTISAAISRAALTNMNFTSGSDIVQQAGVDTLGGDVIVSAGSVGGHAYGSGVPGIEFALLGASTGTVSFGSGPVLSLGLGSLASHEALDVNGKVNLTGLGLDLTGAWVPVFNDVMTIVNNDGIDPIIGTFTGYPQGSLVNYNGDNLLISYVGGTGNDVSLTAVGEFVTSGGVLVLNEEDFLTPSTVPGTIANATVINGNVTFSDGDRVRLTLPAGKTVTAATAVITNIVGGSGAGVNTPGIIRFKDTGGTTLSTTNFIANGSHSLNLPAPQVTGTFDLEMVSPTKTLGTTSGNAKYVVTLTIGDVTLVGPAPVNFTLGDVITGANATDATGAQDGTQFDALQRSGYLAENGTLAFLGYLKVGVGGVTNSNFMGYWKEEAGSPTLTRLARMGDNAPETGANAAKFNILPLIPGINEAGQVTLFASLQQSSASTPPTTADNDVGLWSEIGGTGFQILMREGNAIPGLGANAPKVDSLGYGCFATAKTSASTGEAAFVVGMKGSSTDTALLRASVVDSDTTQVGFIARENTLAPGTSENFGGLDNNVTRSARMDAQGNVVFGAQLKTTGRIGLWFQPIGGAVQKVLLTGDAAPGTTATFQQLDLPSMGGNGTYAFRGVLNTVGDNANNDRNDGIWKGTAATAPTLILRRGDNNTSRPGLFGSSYTNAYPNIKAGNIYNGWLTNQNHGAWLGWVDLGGDGISAFPYDGNFNSSTDTFGIYTDVTGTMNLLVTSGDNAPGIAGSKFFFIDHPVCGGFEQVAFIATVNGGGVTAGQNDKGIWRTNPQSTVPVLVLRTGDSMTVNINGTISSKTIMDLDIPGSGYADHIWETPVMDQNGRLLIFVTFTDGSTTQVIVP